MATVKGDVHDIGKNIVGVVLACNNYEVIDLGVMVSAQKILETARSEKVDIDRPVRPHHALARRDGERGERDGARGLRHSAADRRRHDEPRPHGGEDPPELPARARRSTSTTRAAPSASCRRCSRARRRTITSRRCRPSTARSRMRMRARRPTSSACRSRRRAPTGSKIDWASYQPPKPTFTGARVFRSYDVGELVPYIDWTPFFQTWEMKGRYPGDPRGRRAGRGRAPALRRRARRC